jgi:hypothetical protein
MPSESTITEAKRRWRGFWRRNSSIVLMVLAQLISSFIAVAAKLLQTSSEDYGALDTRQVCAQRGWLGIGVSRLIGQASHDNDECNNGLELALDVLDRRASSAIWHEECMGAVDASRHRWSLW